MLPLDALHIAIGWRVNNDKKQRFFELFHALCLIHCKTFTEKLAESWWVKLRDLDWAQFESGILHLCNNGRMPVPNTLRGLCRPLPAASWSFGELMSEALRRGLHPDRQLGKLELLDLLDIDRV